jgi:hypothetical protein
VVGGVKAGEVVGTVNVVGTVVVGPGAVSEAAPGAFVGGPEFPRLLFRAGSLDRSSGPPRRFVRRRTALRPAARMIATSQSVIPIFRIVDHLEKPQ